MNENRRAYQRAHRRIRSELGQAAEQTCVSCGRQALDWAFSQPTGFSEDPSQYVAMCRSCHILLDGNNPNTGRTHCRRGHEFTLENTYLYRGSRQCLSCRDERSARYIAEGRYRKGGSYAC